MNICINCNKSERKQGITKVFEDTQFELVCRECRCNIGYICGGCSNVMIVKEVEIPTYCKGCKRDIKLGKILEDVRN